MDPQTAPVSLDAERMDNTYDDLSTCLRAVVLLHQQGRVDLLLQIDPTGALVTGECSHLYAALMMRKFQMCQVQKHEGVARGLADVMADYEAGQMNIHEAARECHLSVEKFRGEFKAQYGGIPERGFRKSGPVRRLSLPEVTLPLPAPGPTTPNRDAYEMYKAGVLNLPDAAKAAGVRRAHFEAQLVERGIPRRGRGRPSVREEMLA